MKKNVLYILLTFLMLPKIYANDKLATKFNLEIANKEITKKINNENYSNFKVINSSNKFSNYKNGSLNTNIFNSFINPPSDTIYENIPIMTNSDLSAVMDWIKGKVTAVKSPFCWKKTYGRGAGYVLQCPPGTIPDETGGPVGLCYPKCKDGYTGVGPVCWEICPSDFTNTGAFCGKGPYSKSSNAGKGVYVTVNCPKGTTNTGGSCLGSFGRGGGRDDVFYDGWGKCASDDGGGNKANCEKWGARVYPKCQYLARKYGYENPDNWTNDACCMCSPSTRDINKVGKCLDPNYPVQSTGLCYIDCKKKYGDGYYNNGTSCWFDALAIPKKTYGRGFGVVRSVCADGLVKDAALCYPICSDGMYGVGPVCWQSCPNGMVNCGAGCGISEKQCYESVGNMIFSTVVLAATIGLQPAGAGKVPSALQQLTTIGKAAVIIEKESKVAIALAKCLDKIAKGVSAVKDLTVVKKGIAFAGSGTYKVIDGTIKTSKLEYGLVNDYKNTYSQDFATITSPDINAQLDQNFHPDVAKYLKQTWAGMQMKEMADQLAFQIADNVMDGLSIISIAEPTGIMSGVISTVQAYTKPTCAANAPFPTVVANKYKNKL